MTENGDKLTTLKRLKRTIRRRCVCFAEIDIQFAKPGENAVADLKPRWRGWRGLNQDPPFGVSFDSSGRVFRLPNRESQIWQHSDSNRIDQTRRWYTFQRQGRPRNLKEVS